MTRRKLTFEDRILRSSYFKNISDNNIDLKPYMALSYSTANLCYNKHQCSFKKIPMTREDVRSISLVYVYIYLSLYKKEGLTKKQERNVIISFIRQKFGSISQFCNNKGKNILAREDLIIYVKETANSKKVSRVEIAENPTKYGYDIIDKRLFNRAKIITRSLGIKRDVIGEDGFKMYKLTIVDTTFGLTGSEYKETIASTRYLCTSPEENLLEQEESDNTESYETMFKSLSRSERNTRLLEFIRKNNGILDNRPMVLLARQYLKYNTFSTTLNNPVVLDNA